MQKKFASALALATVACLTLATPVFAADGDATLEKITMFTQVHGDGQKVEEIIYTVDDVTTLEAVTAEDFTFSGMTYGWLNSNEGVSTDYASPSGYRSTEATPFEADITAVVVDEEANTVTLTVENFTPKYYYVESYSVVCATDSALSFENTIAVNDDMSFENTNELVEVITPDADEFEFITVEQGDDALANFAYYLYTPEDTTEALPLVLSNHGSGDQMTLLANRVTLSFAQSGVQDENPAYVLAPIYPQLPDDAVPLDYQDEVIANTMALIQEMVDDGLVDPDRIYISGKSMGGGNTMKIASLYPEVFAAAMPLCASYPSDVEYTAVGEALKDMPIYFIVGEEDSLYVHSESYYNATVEAGNVKANIFAYTGAEMMSRGVAKAHDVEIISLEDERYFDWLFAQTKEADDAVIDYITVETISPARGHTIDTITLYVNDASALEGIDSPEDFTDGKLTGNTRNWASTIYDGEYQSETTVPFEAIITDVAVDGNKLTLTFDPLKGYVDNDPDQGVDESYNGFKKYFYVTDFVVTCETNPDLSFTKDMVGNTTCEVADEFIQFTADHTADFDYNLFTPEGSVANGEIIEAMPLVLVLHGSGDQENLLANRTAVAWAEEAVQAEMPCYVLAPVYTDQFSEEALNATTAQAVALIQDMIDAGMVDASRVYVTGKSMGGQNTLRALVNYPDFFAAGMPLSGGHPFAEEDFDAAVEILKDATIHIIHSEGDFLTEGTEELYAALVAAGSDVLYSKYMPEDLYQDGLEVKPHDTEIIAMEDITFMEWMMAQKLDFTDTADHWAKDAIDAVVELGLMSGTGLTFNPDGSLTRGDFVTALYAMAGTPETGDTTFVDVTEDMDCFTAVAWAAEQGIILGVGDDCFAPDAEITQEQAATILYNYTTVYGDDTTELALTTWGTSEVNSISTWATAGMSWAVEAGVMDANEEGTAAPTDVITRAEVASMLSLYLSPNLS